MTHDLETIIAALRAAGEATRRTQAARIEQLLREIDAYGRQAMCESARIAELKAEVAALQEQLRDREKDLTFEYAGRERAQAALRDVAAYLGPPAEHPADDSGMRELAQKVQDAL